LFSYQPPFNLLAFILLKPASYILTPRALHSANVFLIRLTVGLAFFSSNILYLPYRRFVQSFPILIVISLYERKRAFGGPFTRSRAAAHSIYNSLPRRIKSVPILEAIVGHDSEDLYEAIFEVENDTQNWGLFWDSDEELTPMLRSRTVSEIVVPPFLSGNGNGAGGSGNGAESSAMKPPSGGRRSASRGSTSRRRPPPPPEQQQQQQQSESSPRKRKTSSVVAGGGGVPLALSTTGLTYSNSSHSAIKEPMSPLVRLFSPRQVPVPVPVVSPATPDLAPLEAGMRKMETMLEEIKGLPVKKLKDEMKELQVGGLIDCNPSLFLGDVAHV
jgi:hypothetical protein